MSLQDVADTKRARARWMRERAAWYREKAALLDRHADHTIDEAVNLERLIPANIMDEFTMFNRGAEFAP